MSQFKFIKSYLRILCSSPKLLNFLGTYHFTKKSGKLAKYGYLTLCITFIFLIYHVHIMIPI